MVKIRLRRTGAKKQPHYRVVVTDSKAPRDGKFIEIIGHYNPRTEPVTVEIDAERALYWLSVGAQPSAAVKRLLDKMGIMAQVAAVRKGEVSVEQLAAQFRAEAEAEAAQVIEPFPAELLAEVEDLDEEAVDEEDEEAVDEEDEEAVDEEDEEVEVEDEDEEEAEEIEAEAEESDTGAPDETDDDEEETEPEDTKADEADPVNED